MLVSWNPGFANRRGRPLRVVLTHHKDGTVESS